MKTTQSLTTQVSQKFSIARFVGFDNPIKLKAASIVLGLIVASNVLTHSFFGKWGTQAPQGKEPLYLIEKANVYVTDTRAFETKVREVAQRLNVEPEWLMAVMFSESRFDAAAVNHKGSGAVGLIQFMPTTAVDMNVSLSKISNMTHVEQLEYVYRYLEGVRGKYGDFKSLTQLYLAILYPKALTGDYCYTLYAKPSQAYKQNAGLDEDKDGRVTVSDVDRRMQRVFPSAYIAGKKQKVDEVEATQVFTRVEE